MKTYKLSLHSHTSDFAYLIGTHPKKKEYFSKLISSLIRKHGNIVLGVSNFNDDDRYKKLLGCAKLLPSEYVLNLENKDYFFSVSYKHKKIHFVKTDEIGTDKGHILVIGYKGHLGGRKLGDVLREAHKEHCIIIANHPLHHFGISYFLFKKVFGAGDSASLDEKTLVKYKKDLDALELNAYFPEDWKKIRNFSKKNKIPVVSDSDAHFLDEIFASYYYVNDIDFNDVKNFKISLKRALKNNLHIHAAKHGYFAEYKHILQVVIELVGLKLGLIRR